MLLGNGRCQRLLAVEQSILGSVRRLTLMLVNSSAGTAFAMPEDEQIAQLLTELDRGTSSTTGDSHIETTTTPTTQYDTADTGATDNDGCN